MGDKILYPFELEELDVKNRKVRVERQLYYFLESRALGFARKLK